MSLAGISTAAQTQFTVLAIVDRTGSNSFSTITQSSGTNSGFNLQCNGASLGLSKGGVVDLNTVTLPSGPHVIVASHDQASGQYYLLIRPLSGGPVVRTSQSNTQASTASNGSATISRNSGANAFPGHVGLVLAGFTFLPEAVGRELLANPWQVFAPRRTLAPFTLAGGGGISSGNGLSVNVASAIGQGLSLFQGIGSSSSVAAVSGQGASQALAQGSATGTSTVVAIGSSAFLAVGSSLSTSSASGQGRSAALAQGTAAGSSSAAAFSLGAMPTGSVSGTSTASGQGMALFQAIGSSVSASVVFAVGSATHRATGSAAGTSIVSASGSSLVLSTGSSSGTSTAQGQGNGTIFVLATGLSIGGATVSGQGSALVSATGIAAGISTVSGEASAIATAVGLAAGWSSSSGVSTTTYPVPPTTPPPPFVQKKVYANVGSPPVVVGESTVLRPAFVVIDETAIVTAGRTSVSRPPGSKEDVVKVTVQ